MSLSKYNVLQPINHKGQLVESGVVELENGQGAKLEARGIVEKIPEKVNTKEDKAENQTK